MVIIFKANDVVTGVTDVHIYIMLFPFPFMIVISNVRIGDIKTPTREG